jgi:hypothetical protein
VFVVQIAVIFSIYIYISEEFPHEGVMANIPQKNIFNIPYVLLYRYIYIYSYPPITHFPEVSPVEWEFYKVPNPFNSPKNRKYISRNYQLYT